MHYIGGEILQEHGTMAVDMDRDTDKYGPMGKARKPNWTDSEIQCLIEGYRQWMHILKPKSGNVAPLAERHRIWATIADNVNSYDGGQPGCVRAIKEVQKKWENLTNRMRMELLQDKSEPGFEVSPTSRIINALVNNCDLSDIDMVPTHTDKENIGIVKLEQDNDYDDDRETHGDLEFSNFDSIIGSATKDSSESISSEEPETSNTASDIPVAFIPPERYSSNTSFNFDQILPRKLSPEPDINNLSETSVPSPDNLHTQTEHIIRETSHIFPTTNSNGRISINVSSAPDSGLTSARKHVTPHRQMHGLQNNGYLGQMATNSRTFTQHNRRLNLTKRVNSLNPYLQSQVTRRLQDEVLQLKKRRLLADLERIQLDKERLKLETENLAIEKETAELLNEKVKYELELLKRT